MRTAKYMTNLTADTSRGPSQALWKGCPWMDMIEDPGIGMAFFDDFLQVGLITSPTTEAALVGTGYSGFGSSGATIVSGAVHGGVIALTEATDNEAVFMKAEGHPFQISASKGKLWFEARVKVSAITDNQIGFILGLMDTSAMTVNVPLSTANPPVLDGCNYVGFWGREEDAGAVSSAYFADGTTYAAGTNLISSGGAAATAVHQFVADTYVKLGMVFDPNDKDGANLLSFYVNGVRHATTKTVPNDTGTDFPADVTLSPIVGHRLGASTSSVTTIDWWRCAQLFV